MWGGIYWTLLGLGLSRVRQLAQGNLVTLMWSSAGRWPQKPIHSLSVWEALDFDHYKMQYNKIGV